VERIHGYGRDCWLWSIQKPVKIQANIGPKWHFRSDDFSLLRYRHKAKEKIRYPKKQQRGTNANRIPQNQSSVKR
jgi:hypothetical protein